MSFCYHCGVKLGESDQFCADCGADLRDLASSNAESQDSAECESKYLSIKNLPKGKQISGAKSQSYLKKGLLLTNSRLLAKKLGVDEECMVTILNEYIHHMKSMGYMYTLVNTITFTRNNKWYEYHDILLNTHKSERSKGEQESEYLFIIGGNDIIPVPVINNYVDNSDDVVETDILYAYPYGAKTQTLLESTELYKAEALFMVSRLPLASDASFERLLDFLQRSLDCHANGGIQMTYAYGHSDPNWKRVSTKVIERLTVNGLFPQYKKPLPQEVFTGQLFMSPPVEHSNLAEVFNTNASLFYFNLHGSDQPDANYYLGEEYMKKSYAVAGFTADAIRAAQNPNIFVAECCYGAKHVGYDIEHCILNSAMMSNTMIFLGASKIAYGQVDQANGGAVGALSSADLLSAAFIEGLLNGMSAGEALMLARYMFFCNKDGNLSPFDALTLCEFNLYGDPMLGIAGQFAGKSNAVAEGMKSLSKNQIASKDANLGMNIEPLIKEPSSLLQRVRGAVDANIKILSDRIGQQLYAQYGMKPREPKQILKVNYKNGDSEYCVLYEEQHDKICSQVVVSSTNEGEIKSVVMSK